MIYIGFLFALIYSNLAEEPSKETRGITACWILSVKHSTDNEDMFIRLLDILEPIGMKPHHFIHVSMIKRCFPKISQQDTDQVLSSMDDPSTISKSFLDIVPNFDFKQVLKEYQDNSKSRQTIDALILMFVQELEMQYGYSEEQSDNGQDKTEGLHDL